MKSVNRYQSQLLLRKSYKIPRTFRFWSNRGVLVFRPKRDGPAKRTNRCPFGIGW